MSKTLGYKEEKINLTDGVRIDFEEQKEWVHLRKSNTEPIIRIYAEGQDQAKAEALARKIMQSIESITRS